MIDDVIEVRTISAAYIELDVPEGIARELNDFFSFMAPNYRYMPRYKNGLWDGKIRLYKAISSTLPSGLFEVLCQFAEEREYEILDNRKTISYPTENIDSFIEELQLQSEGKPIEFRDYQRSAFDIALKDQRATILSSTSSGKSLIIYALVRFFSQVLPGKILIIVPNVGLVHQLIENFEDYSTANGWNVDRNVHKMYEGQAKNKDCPIYISTWQSIYSLPKSYFKQFSYIGFDEVHLATAESVNTIMNNSVNAHVRHGFTGTLKESKLHKLSVTGLFGPIRKVTNTRQLMDEGYIADLKIKIVVLKYNKAICKEICAKKKVPTPSGVMVLRNNYVNELDYITQCSERNMFIFNLASALSGNILILFHKVEKHGKPLYELFKKHLDKSRKLYYISGETDGLERERIRRQIDTEKDSILIASYGTVSTGTNIKNLDYGIFGSPYKSEIKVLQSIGRILRKSSTKSKAVLFDLVDDMSHGSKYNYCYTHFMKRLEMYKEEKFPMTVSQYTLK